jgi:hypothetical protein
LPSSFSSVSKSRSDRSSSYTEQRELVHRVISVYADTCSLPALSTFILQEDGLCKSQRILYPGSIGIHYKADVEKITERELKDKPAHQETWWAIALGETPGGLSEVHLVQKLQKAYRAIDPWRYFRPALHRGSVESQRRRLA